MRLNKVALGLLLPAAAILSGCGAGTLATPSATPLAMKAIKGKAFGGQQPVTGSQIALYAFGSTGYGSVGTLLATSTTDSGGYFNIDPSTLSCPTPDTPVYIVSLGGNPGNGTNSAIALGSGIGRCADAANAFVTINEISTAMLAYTFSHFFSTGNGDGTTPDHFGAPAKETQVIQNANNGNGTLFTLLDVENGYPRVNTSTHMFEGAKLITLGNILGACVNSSGPGSPSCTNLFLYTTPPNGSAPTNTLEAAVDLALNPLQNTSLVYSLQPQSGAAAFTGGLTSPPADWTLSASYTSPSFSLAVNSRTDSTIDIDSTGRVWFPSNGPSNPGVGFFDPSTGSFSQLFSAGLTHPQQVAIDVDDVAWANDLGSSNIAGFPGGAPGNATTLTLPGTSSQSVTVAFDNTLRYGITAPDGLPALAQVTGKANYSEVNGSEIPGGGDFLAASLAGDVDGGFGIAGAQRDQPTLYDFYFGRNGGLTPITYQSFRDAGQVVFTGTNFVATRGGFTTGDGICIWSSQACFDMTNTGDRHPSGLSLDGASTLWLADTNGNTVEEIPFTNNSYLTGSNTANNNVLLHDTNNGGTLPTPVGIAVDRAGNVWVSNYGCYGTGCTPGSSFTLSELIGAGTPTITPVSRQIVIDNLVGTQPQIKRSGTKPQ